MELRDFLKNRAEQNLSKLLCLNDKCISLNIIYIGYPNEKKNHVINTMINVSNLLTN